MNRILLKRPKKKLTFLGGFTGLVLFSLVIFTIPYLTMYIYEFMTPFMLPRVVEEGWIAGRLDYWHAFWLNLGGGGAFFWSRK
jgi:hypothetical protein